MPSPSTPSSGKRPSGFSRVRLCDGLRYSPFPFREGGRGGGSRGYWATFIRRGARDALPLGAVEFHVGRRAEAESALSRACLSLWERPAERSEDG